MKHILSWFSGQVRYSVALPIFVLSFALFASAVIPLLVTIDGIIYVANAKSILTPDFAGLYTLYREPGYPLFLKAIHFWGDAGVLIVLAQSALLAASGLMALIALIRVLPRPGLRRWELIVLWIFLINPMFLGYSGTVLQQALFTFQLAGFGLLLSFALRPPAALPRWIISAMGAVWYITCIATSIGWIYLGLLPLTAIFVALLLKPIRKLASRISGRQIVFWLLGALMIPLTLAATYTLGRQTYQAWEDFKTPYIQEEVDDGYVIKPLDSVPALPTPAYLTERVLSLMNITVMDPYEKENDLFLGIQMRRQSPSSSWDSAWEGEPQASYALNYFVITNPGEILHNGYARLASIAPLWYQLTLIAMWLVAALLLVFRRVRALLILLLGPINFLLVYAASNSPIDRYGVPTYAFAAASVVIVFGLKSVMNRGKE